MTISLYLAQLLGIGFLSTTTYTVLANVARHFLKYILDFTIELNSNFYKGWEGLD